jgi:c-di-GMP-binding flagellar brake protein YcgR
MEQLMQFDGAAKKLEGNHLEREAKGRDPLVNANVPKPIRIPFRIDDAIMLRSLANQAHIAKSRVIGAMHGKFILIMEPTARINDRLSAVLDQDFLCSYFNDGTLHTFYSRYRRHLLGDIVCIEYPREVEVRQIRKHRRIRVNIETQCTLDGTVDVFLAEMADISQGGCRLVLNERVRFVKGINLSLTFNLPNEAFVSGLQTVVARITRIQNGQATELGVSFIGPESETAKIANFCEFCMYFDLEGIPVQT